MAYIHLENNSWIENGYIPESILPSEKGFKLIWEMHPNTFHKIKLFGKEFNTPRWQQSYGKDYKFSGTLSKALPIPNILKPFLQWANNNEIKKGRNGDLNGLLLNWYKDGEHNIGWHSDSESQLDNSRPIYTISLGASRKFKIKHVKSGATNDYIVNNGSYLIMGGDMQAHYKHSVPKSKKITEPRISITIRKFN